MPRHYHSYSDLPGSLPLFPLTGEARQLTDEERDALR